MNSNERSHRNNAAVVIAWCSLFSIILAVVSLYHFLLIKLNLQHEPSFCNISQAFNCDKVNDSPYAMLFGFPLAGYGVGFYAAMLLFSVFSTDDRQVTRRVFGNLALLIFLLVSVFSVVLFIISEVELGTLCLVCMGMYLLNFLSLFAAYRAKGLGQVGGFVARIVDAGIMLISLPGIALGIGQFKESPAKSSVRTAMLMYVALFFAAFSLPETLVIHLIANQQEKTTPPDPKGAVAMWEREPTASLNFKTGSPLEADFDKGPADAPIQFVEFSDFECPVCRRMYFVFEEILKKYGNKIHFVFKNYPLDKSCNPRIKGDFHKNSCYSAQFTRCAGEQGRFWDAADYIFRLEAFEKSEGAGGADQVRPEIDKGIDVLHLDGVAMKACMSTNRYGKKILSDISEGDALGIEGTPSIWINGKKVTNGRPEVLEKIFAEILK